MFPSLSSQGGKVVLSVFGINKNFGYTWVLTVNKTIDARLTQIKTGQNKRWYSVLLVGLYPLSQLYSWGGTQTKRYTLLLKATLWYSFNMPIYFIIKNERMIPILLSMIPTIVGTIMLVVLNDSGKKGALLFGMPSSLLNHFLFIITTTSNVDYWILWLLIGSFICLQCQ